MGHAYATPTEFVAWVQTQEATELSDLYDPTGTIIDQARIEGDLVAQSRVLDSYLRGRYSVPILPTPLELLPILYPLVRLAQNPLASVDSRTWIEAQHSIKRLLDYSAGRAVLDTVGGDDPQPPESQIQSSPGFAVDLEGYL